MTIRQAIREAIKGGYKMLWDKGLESAYPYRALLDPLFWSCLGKAMGWKTYTWTSWKGWDEYYLTQETDSEEFDPPFENAFCQRHITSIYKQHQLIDHLASGQSVESFFETL